MNLLEAIRLYCHTLQNSERGYAGREVAYNEIVKSGITKEMADAIADCIDNNGHLFGSNGEKFAITMLSSSQMLFFYYDQNAASIRVMNYASKSEFIKNAIKAYNHRLPIDKRCVRRFYPNSFDTWHERDNRGVLFNSTVVYVYR